jgi:cytochrome c peroxidase
MSASALRARGLALASSCALVGGASAAEPAVELSERELAIVLTLSPLAPPPADTTNRAAENPAGVALGKRLFFDVRLSGNGKVACSTCHVEAHGWADGKTVAVGAGSGTRNTPSLWNAAHNRWFFWDGRADSLWAQAVKPIEDGAEMDGDRLHVLQLVANDADLRRDYEGLFGALPPIDATFPLRGGPFANDGERQANWWGMSNVDRDAASTVLANVGKAIAAYVATIRTAPAPFDRFVADMRAGRTESRAISAAAQRGLKTFIGKGNCVLCHSGPAFTNFEFHDTRVPPPSADAPLDPGRLGGVARLLADEFGAAGPHSDDPSGARAELSYFVSDMAGLLGHFKTPGLRNVALTAPYMHAGQLPSLTAVVEHYSSLEGASPPADPAHVEALIAPIGLDATEIADVVAFLESLTGDAPGAIR